MLKGKKIIVGITGSIAAYKAAILVRELVKNGAEVKVVMTPLAKEFITPLTLATLSQNPILVEFFNPENGEWNSHVKLGLWADAFIVAPATANTIAKMATGVADNLLLTTYLSARCSVFVCPAMDYDMYQHPTTKLNIKKLHSFGNRIIEPTKGFLASGLNGKGRMEEPENIVKYVADFFASPNYSDELSGKRVIISAGGSIEPIDAVRFISNYSTGKMGYAIAKECVRRGADVRIVHGSIDSRLKGSLGRVSEIETLSADEMYRCLMAESLDADVVIMAAAVADFTPKNVIHEKIKKEEGCDELTLELRKTKDIAAKLGSIKPSWQTLVGFALETGDEEANALKKMERKNLDMIVLNSLNDTGAGYKHDTNKITIYHADKTQKNYPLKEKCDVAKDIVDQMCSIVLKKQPITK